ncbi:hypothetical protein BJ741DRAFT_611507, partial [Chytriomyces cf. hyalinus JEL632]
MFQQPTTPLLASGLLTAGSVLLSAWYVTVSPGHLSSHGLFTTKQCSDGTCALILMTCTNANYCLVLSAFRLSVILGKLTRPALVAGRPTLFLFFLFAVSALTHLPPTHQKQHSPHHNSIRNIYLIPKHVPPPNAPHHQIHAHFSTPIPIRHHRRHSNTAIFRSSAVYRVSVPRRSGLF